MSTLSLNPIQVSQISQEVIQVLELQQHLIIVDPSVYDYQFLLNNVDPAIPDQTQILVLNPDQDGINQITKVLVKFPEINTVHIICHGAPAALYLGSSQLNLDNLESYSESLQGWFKSQSQAEILLYGCEVAKGCRGAGFVNRLSEITGANIAASTSLMGDAKQGGNWQLEFQTGVIHSHIAFPESVLQEYPFTLSFPNPLYATTGGAIAAGTTPAIASDIYILNPDNGNALEVGNLAFPTTGITRDQNTGRVYYTERANPAGRRLAYWDPATGQNQIIGNLSTNLQFLKLAQAQDGTIYGMTNADSNLYRINPDTAAVTNLGAVTGLPGASGDIAFDPTNSNLLWVLITTTTAIPAFSIPANSVALYQFDITNLGAGATQVALSTGTIDPVSGGSIAFGENGNLFLSSGAGGASPHTLYEFDGTNFISQGSTTEIFSGGELVFSDFGALPTTTPEAELRIEKTADQETAIPGQNLTYTITIFHEGGDSLCQLGLFDVVPSELSNVMFDEGGLGTYLESTGIWTGLNFNSGESISLTITGLVDPGAMVGSFIENKVATGLTGTTVSFNTTSGLIDGFIDNNLSNNTAVLLTLVDTPPIAVNDTATTLIDTNVTIPILSNDSDPDMGDSPQASSIDLDPSTPGQQTTFTVPGQGTFSVNTNTGIVTFDPDPNFVGTVSIPYTVEDTFGVPSNTASISVTIVNQPPIAENDTAVTPVNTPVSLDILTNDTDPDGTLLASTIDLDPNTPGQQTTFTVPGEGVFTVNTTTGLVLFTPDLNFTGTSIIPYVVSDNFGATATADISVTVTNIPPIATDDSTTIPAGSTATLDILANDTDPDGTLLASTIDLDPNTPGQQTTFTVPGEGAFTVNTNTGLVMFTPEPGFTGTSMIPYTVADDGGATATANISVTVTNLPPTAINDVETTPLNTPVLIDILANDDDPDGPALTGTNIDLDPSTPGIQTTVTTSDGTFVVSGNQVLFTPNLNFTGTASIPYLITDNAGATATANISVTVQNQPPTAINDNETTPLNTPVLIDILANDNDPDGPALTGTNIDLDPSTPGIQTTVTTSDGTFVVSGNQVLFTPNLNFTGTASIPYLITDNAGGTATANISVTVGNEVPEALDDVTTTSLNTPVTLNILSNDSDPEDGDIDPSTIDLDPTMAGIQTTVTVAGGTFTVNTNTGLVTFNPETNFTGPVTIPYVIADTTGATATANITINVGNNPPTAVDDTATTPANTPVPINILANDTDPENNIDPGTIDLDPNTPGQQTTLTVPGQGTFTVQPNDPGIVLFTPAPGFSGMAMIPYTVSDTGGAISNQAKITVNVGTVPSLNQPPTARPDIYTTPRNTPLTIPPAQGVLINDTDPNPGDILRVTNTTPFMTGNGGTVMFNPDGSFTYTPDPTFSGPDTFTYTVTDGNGGTSIAQVTVTVGGTINNPPDAQNKTATVPPTDVFVPVPPLSATDPEGDPIISYTVTPPSPNQGILLLDNVPITNPRTLTPEQASRLIFQRNPNFTGDVTFPYTATDSNGNTDQTPATVTISVSEFNRPPAPNNLRTPTTPNDTQIGIPPLSATDPDGDTITFFNITPPNPGQGTLYLNGVPITSPRSLTPQEASQLVFRPNPSFMGDATFTFTATDSRGSTSTTPGIVTIPILEAMDDTVPGGQDNPMPNEPPNSPDIIFVPPSSGGGSPTSPGGSPTSPGGSPTSPGGGGSPTSPGGSPTSPGGGGSPTSLGGNLNLEPIQIPTLTATDPEGDPIIGFILSNLPDASQGVLFLNGQPVTSGQQITPDEASQLLFIPNPEYTGTVTFNFAAVDINGTTDQSPASVTFRVVGVGTVYEDCPFEIPDFGGAPSIDDGITLAFPVLDFVNNVVLGGSGDETLIGETLLNNFMLGGAGNDSVIGGDTADILVGGLGSLVPVGSEIDRDQLFGNRGNDVIKGDEGDDSIYAGRDNDWVWGGKDNDLAFGDFGNDTLLGDKGNDQLFGGDHDINKPDITGEDLLLGFSGNDSLNGNEASDTVSGGEDDDYVRGGQADDLLFGELGNDLMFGDRGSDTVSAGKGDDTLVGNNGDPLDEDPGDDTLFGEEGNDLIWGDRGADWILGDTGEDTVFAGKDNDVVRGGMDDDVIFGDLGDDSLAGDKGNDCIFGGVRDLDQQPLDGRDLIHGNDGNDTINGYDNDDSLDGGDGDDYIRGGKEHDMLHGGSGTDLMFGDMGNDSLCGDDGDDTLIGNNGDSLNGDRGQDLLIGGAGDDLILGDRGQDLLSGGDGDDTLFGGKENDTLIGGRGNDVLFGNLGNDWLTGGSGADIFVLTLGSDPDTITDFNLGQDSLALDGLLPEQLEITSVNNGASIQLVETGKVLVQLFGVSVDAANQPNFLRLTNEGTFVSFSIPEIETLSNDVMI